MPEPIAVAYIIGKIKESATERIKEFAKQRLDEARHWSDNRKLFPKIRKFVAATTKTMEKELDWLLSQVQAEFERRYRAAADEIGAQLQEVRDWLDQVTEMGETFSQSMGVQFPAVAAPPKLSIPPGHPAAKAIRDAAKFVRSVTSGTYTGTERTGVEIQRSLTKLASPPSAWAKARTEARDHVEKIWTACKALAKDRGIDLGCEEQ